jgi:ribosomal 30S subunit maturation factor RimM
MRSTLLTVSRAELPPLGEGEYYYSDLIGLPAFLPTVKILAAVSRLTISAQATSLKSKSLIKSVSWCP